MNGPDKMQKIKYKEFKKALIRIKPSKMIKGGIGVFAIRYLKKGSIIGLAKMFGEDFFTKKSIR